MSNVQYLMSFELFSSRRGFSIEKFLTLNPNVTYEIFSQLLINKKVCPPSEDFFLIAKSKVNIKEKEDIVLKEESPQEVKKVTRKRRTRKAKSNED